MSALKPVLTVRDKELLKNNECVSYRKNRCDVASKLGTHASGESDKVSVNESINYGHPME